MKLGPNSEADITNVRVVKPGLGSGSGPALLAPNLGEAPQRESSLAAPNHRDPSKSRYMATRDDTAAPANAPTTGCLGRALNLMDEAVQNIKDKFRARSRSRSARARSPSVHAGAAPLPPPSQRSFVTACSVQRPDAVRPRSRPPALRSPSEHSFATAFSHRPDTIRSLSRAPATLRSPSEHSFATACSTLPEAARSSSRQPGLEPSLRSPSQLSAGTTDSFHTALSDQAGTPSLAGHPVAWPHPPPPPTHAPIGQVQQQPAQCIGVTNTKRPNRYMNNSGVGAPAYRHDQEAGGPVTVQAVPALPLVQGVPVPPPVQTSTAQNGAMLQMPLGPVKVETTLGPYVSPPLGSGLGSTVFRPNLAACKTEPQSILHPPSYGTCHVSACAPSAQRRWPESTVAPPCKTAQRPLFSCFVRPDLVHLQAPLDATVVGCTPPQLTAPRTKTELPPEPCTAGPAQKKVRFGTTAREVPVECADCRASASRASQSLAASGGTRWSRSRSSRRSSLDPSTDARTSSHRTHADAACSPIRVRTCRSPAPRVAAKQPLSPPLRPRSTTRPAAVPRLQVDLVHRSPVPDRGHQLPSRPRRQDRTTHRTRSPVRVTRSPVRIDRLPVRKPRSPPAARRSDTSSARSSAQSSARSSARESSTRNGKTLRQRLDATVHTECFTKALDYGLKELGKEYSTDPNDKSLAAKSKKDCKEYVESYTKEMISTATLASHNAPPTKREALVRAADSLDRERKHVDQKNRLDSVTSKNRYWKEQMTEMAVGRAKGSAVQSGDRDAQKYLERFGM